MQPILSSRASLEQVRQSGAVPDAPYIRTCTVVNAPTILIVVCCSSRTSGKTLIRGGRMYVSRPGRQAHLWTEMGSGVLA
jgi:hypothetical protein